MARLRSGQIHCAAGGAARRRHPFLAHASLRPRGRLSSRPYYLEATPGFEIRVHLSDLDRANGALEWVESKESEFRISGAKQFGESKVHEFHPALPYDWDPEEATFEVWSGEDESLAEYLASALRENGIPSHIPDELGHRVRLCVRPGDLTRARDIVREIAEG